MPVSIEERKARARVRARKWVLDNPDRVKARSAAHYRANVEDYKARATARRLDKLEEIREYDRKRAAKNREQKKEYDREYRARNAARIRMAKSEWAKSPQGKASYNANSARRRARLKNLDHGCASREELIGIWKYDYGLCYACGATGTSFDHVWSLANGGLHCVANLRVACQSCNSTKNHRDLEYLLERLAQQGVPISPQVYAPALPCPREEY